MFINCVVSAGQEVITKLKEKIEELRNMSSANNTYNNNYNGNMYYSQVAQATSEEVQASSGAENEEQQPEKSYLDDGLDEILAKIDV